VSKPIETSRRLQKSIFNSRYWINTLSNNIQQNVTTDSVHLSIANLIVGQSEKRWNLVKKTESVGDSVNLAELVGLRMREYFLDVILSEISSDY